MPEWLSPQIDKEAHGKSLHGPSHRLSLSFQQISLLFSHSKNNYHRRFFLSLSRAFLTVALLCL